MELSDYLSFSWSEYHLLTQKLAAAILEHKHPYDEIIAISRGGLTLGHILSDLLSLPISTVTIQSYKDLKIRGEVTVSQTLQKPIKGEKILLVDDVSDTGKTLARAKKYLHKLSPSDITIVTLFFKPTSVVRPDFYVRQTDKWIIFPYEITETTKYIIQKLSNEGKSKAEIQEFLVNLGFSESQIEFVRENYISS